jgi:hypothetical protein
MADSEISRTLATISQRNLLLTTADFLRKHSVELRLSVPEPDGQTNRIDSALSCWEEWMIAQEEFTHLIEKQTRLEAALAREVSLPHVHLHVPGSQKPIFVETDEEIDRWLKGPNCEKARLHARMELAARQATWTAADERVGFSRVKRAQEEASDRSCQLSDKLLNTPANSMAAVTAKLHAVITDGEPSPDNDEFPWPQLRSILSDLLRHADSLHTP